MIASLRKRLKVTQRRCQRYKRKIIRLKNLVQHLKKNVISGKKTGKHSGKGRIYSKELTAFALTLQNTWDGAQSRGYVDLGNDVDDDDRPLAKEVLVFMVVCVHSSWKIPCAYFFLDGLNGIERANLIKVCIQRLYDVGVRVISVTCDGPSAHFKMMSELGAKLNPPNNVNPSFQHPSSKDHKVYALLDICHMMKLVRNAFHKHGTLLDDEDNKIEWKYFEALNKLQESEGMHIANKLTKAHMNWWQQKMKVNLAVQLFSTCVANALEYCCKVKKLEQFQGCEATVRFIRMFNDLFDILNSRHPHGKKQSHQYEYKIKIYGTQF